jgi:hypothetical protein
MMMSIAEYLIYNGSQGITMEWKNFQLW